MVLKGLVSVGISAILASFSSLLLNNFNQSYFQYWWWSILFFIAIFTTLNLIKNLKNTPQTSTELLIGGVSVKALVLLIVIFMYSIYDNAKLFQFSMHFIAHYILFTVFEIRYLLSKIKNEQNKK